MKNNPNLIVRRADKANVLVVMNKQEYDEKLDAIVRDESKFKPLTRNPIPDLKVKVN